MFGAPTSHVGFGGTLPSTIGAATPQFNVMPSAKKLRQGLFSISWNVTNIQANGNTPVTNLPDEICDSGTLKYINDGQKIHLEMSFHQFGDSKPFKPDKISILAIKDGVIQKMIFRQTKWTTSWTAQPKRPCTTCGGLRTEAFINILIDLTADLEFAVSKGAKNILDHNLNLWNTKTLADVTFQCNGKEIKAHAIIVAACSSVMATKFENDFKENQEKVCEIKDITPGTLSRLLQFMYTGDASLDSNVSEEEISNLLIASNKYAVETLKEDCAFQLSRNVKAENALRFLVLAHLHNSSVLSESVLEFMSKNAKAVCSRKEWMDIIKNYPELCFQATQFMFGL